MSQKPKLFDYIDVDKFDIDYYSYMVDNNEFEHRNDAAELPKLKSKKLFGKRKVYERKDPKSSQWWHDYVIDANNTYKDESHRDGKLFRRRFTVPFAVKNQITLRAREWYKPGTDATGRNPAPIELLELSTLRILARRWTFDDCSEATYIVKR